MALSLKVRGIGTNKYKTDKFIVILVYFSYKYDAIDVLARIYRKFYLVDDLRVQILIGNNIIRLEKIIIDVDGKIATFSKYNNTVVTIEPIQRR